MKGVARIALVIVCASFSSAGSSQSRNIPGFSPEVVEYLRAQHGDVIVEMLGAVNTEEKNVPEYTVPALVGVSAASCGEWEAERRKLLALFSRQIYGPVPESGVSLSANVVETNLLAQDSTATRKQVAITVGDGAVARSFNLLLHLPDSVDGPVPVFLGLNFHGNHTTHADPAIEVTRAWVRNHPRTGAQANVANTAGRGSQAHRWPVQEILARGYGLATVYYGELAPDDPGLWREGVHPLIPSDEELGAIGVWAWGLSRALDVLLADAAVDGEKVAVLGHSRLGKAALWAGANDPRFAMVISNNSGAMGAALSRRRFGETVGIIGTLFPHWFVGGFAAYRDREADLPVDQHQLLALMAPRPVYVASAAEDLWADPRGEFLSLRLASAVYRLYGIPDISAASMPAVGEAIRSSVGYHIRSGPHDITLEDWGLFMDFAESHWK